MKTTELIKAIEVSCEKRYWKYSVHEYTEEQVGKSFVEEFYVKFNMESFDEQILHSNDWDNLQAASKKEFNDTAYSNELLGIRLYDMILSLPFKKFGIKAVPYQIEYLDKEVIVEYKFAKPLDFSFHPEKSKDALMKVLSFISDQAVVQAEVLDKLDVHQIN